MKEAALEPGWEQGRMRSSRIRELAYRSHGRPEDDPGLRLVARCHGEALPGSGAGWTDWFRASRKQLGVRKMAKLTRCGLRGPFGHGTRSVSDAVSFVPRFHELPGPCSRSGNPGFTGRELRLRTTEGGTAPTVE